MNGTEEEFVPEEEAESGPAAIKKLRERLKKAVEEKQQYLDALQRERADFVNYKKGEAASHGERGDKLKADLVEELLPALDALEMALRHAPENKELKIVEQQFQSSLKKLGVERFGAEGEEFDPSIHEALQKTGEDHIIKSVARSGYKIGNHIIRAAQVII